MHTTTSGWRWWCSIGWLRVAAAFARALELDPRLVDAARNLGRTLNDAGEGSRAAAAYHAWLRVDPDNPDARAGLALAEAMQGNLDGASKALEQLTALPACSAATWQTLGVVQYWDGRLVEAEAAARKALALEPGSSDAAFLVAASLLGRQNYRNGWREFERRTEGSLGNSVRFPEATRWDGKPLAGRLMLYAEQGLGDVVQFSRFVLRARQRAGSVVLLLDQHWASLAPLLASLPGVDAIVTEPTALDSMQDSVAARASILSLPWLLGVDAATVPNGVPYLRAPAAKAAEWAQRLGAAATLRVGIAWAAYSRNQRSYVTRQKSVPFRLLAQLFALRGIEFVSLQKGAAGDAAAGSPVLDTTADLRDFGDTAALIENLDLVISTDTSVAHVAGALGKSVWMLDRYNTCWRWRPSSTTSPWYPTMRIFRQKRVGDWDEVVAQVGAALATHAQTHLRST